MDVNEQQTPNHSGEPSECAVLSVHSVVAAFVTYKE